MGTKKSGGNKQNLVSTEDLIFTQHFYFSENNELKKLSAAPIINGFIYAVISGVLAVLCLVCMAGLSSKKVPSEY